MLRLKVHHELSGGGHLMTFMPHGKPDLGAEIKVPPDGQHHGLSTH